MNISKHQVDSFRRFKVVYLQVKLVALCLLFFCISGFSQTKNGEFQLTGEPGNIAVSWNGKTLINGEKILYGKSSDIMSDKDKWKTTVDAKGWKINNRWDSACITPFRRELAVSPDGKTVELNFQAEIESYLSTVSENFYYSFSVDLASLDGMHYKAIGGRSSRQVIKEGEISKNMPEGSLTGSMVRWIVFQKGEKQLTFDFNPEGVSSFSDYGPNLIQGLWGISVKNGKLYCSFGRHLLFTGGTLNSKVVIFSTKEDYDQRHACRTYSYVSELSAEKLLTFRKDNVGKEYQFVSNDSWKNPEAVRHITFGKSGALYAAVKGDTANTLRVSLPRPGLYIVTLRIATDNKKSGEFSISCNGDEKVKSIQVDKNTITTVCFPQWIENGEANLSFQGKWQLSTVAFQLLLHTHEDFKFRRGFWRLSNEFEPSVVNRSAEYANPPQYKTMIESMPLPPYGIRMPKNFTLDMKRKVFSAPNDTHKDWRYLSSLGSLGPSNTGNFHEFNTPEKIKRRIGELYDAGFNALIINGMLSRHTFPEHEARVSQTLKAITEEAHARGMKIIDHQDLTLLWNWGTGVRNLTARTDELLRSVNAGLATRGFCLNNPKLKKTFINSIIKLVKDTGIDGLMLDEACFHSDNFCGCTYCRAKFKADTGLTLPVDETEIECLKKDSPLWKAWLAWRMKSNGDWWVELRQSLHEVRPDFVIMVYTTHYGWLSTFATLFQGIALTEAARGCDFLGTEIMSRNVAVSYRPVMALRRMKSSLRFEYGKPVFGLVYPMLDWNIAYFGWALNNMNNQLTWLTEPPRIPENENNFAVFKENTDIKNSEYFSDAAMVFSENSKDWPIAFNYAVEPLGTSEIMTDLHLQHEFILEESLSPEKLAGFSKLLVMNASNLSDRHIKNICDFAKRGGTVLLTAHAGACDSQGNLRKRWPFADIFKFSIDIPLKVLNTKNISYGKMAVNSNVPLKYVKTDGKSSIAKPLIVGENGQALAFSIPFGKGKFIYNSLLLGTALVENEQTINQRYKFNPDEALLALYKAFLKDQLGDNSCFQAVSVPEGVISSVTRQKEGKASAIVVHLLNATGVKRTFDMLIPKSMPASMWQNLSQPLVFNVKTEKINNVYAVSPDFPGKHPLDFKAAAPGYWQITVPPELLKRYTLVFIR